MTTTLLEYGNYYYDSNINNDGDYDKSNFNKDGLNDISNIRPTNDKEP